MNNSATIVRVSGETQNLTSRPTLAEAQNTVEGYIELVKARSKQDTRPVTLVVNEDGRSLNLPLNKVITEEYGQSIYQGYIVGDVIVLKGWQTVGS